jgi:hypothetical protein
MGFRKVTPTGSEQPAFSLEIGSDFLGGAQKRVITLRDVHRAMEACGLPDAERDAVLRFLQRQSHACET